MSSPYHHHTFHPVRKIDGRMVVADESEWIIISNRQNVAEAYSDEDRRPTLILIGPEVFGDWDGAIYDSTGDEISDCESLADVRARLFRLIDQCPHVTFCIETDRPDDIYRKFPVRWYQGELTPVMTPPPNFWLGVGPIRTQADADRLIPELLKVPAALHYGVFQPTEEIDLLKDNGLRGWDYLRGWNPDAGDEGANTSRIGWLIIRGDEQPMHPDHVRSLVKHGESADVPCWLEWGEWAPWCVAKIASGWQRTRINGSKIYGTLHNHDFSMGYKKIVLFHGEEFETFHVVEPSGQDYISFVRVGRDRSGSTLDGREWKMVQGTVK